ncbi:GNAT family N-acetyltransferase [Thermococcus sp.]|uniref:GNAT family N-acetyltransferase n=1 Tax=Thermococcus sp. TaxID=35749 RepID=UPI00261ED8DD|nr:GNAT family N-acetyltransferase [Thermococcus sp.]
MEPIIREAKPRDKPFIEEISRLTWGGEDYLARIFDEWVKDGNFYVLEVDGKVIGTAKLTILPGKVGWIEGLRVHPDYRGRGYGRMIHNFILNLGKKLAEKEVIEALEFATYFLNRESVSMAEKTGFHVRAKFFVMSAPAGETLEEPSVVEPSINDVTLGTFPVGWRFLHRCDETVEWLRKNAVLYELNGLRFIGPKGGATFTALDPGPAVLRELMPAMGWVARELSLDGFDVMIPSAMGAVLPGLRRVGFELWDDKDEPNVLVFRKKI